jgi:hypothetical protein
MALYVLFLKEDEVRAGMTATQSIFARLIPSRS